MKPALYIDADKLPLTETLAIHTFNQLVATGIPIAFFNLEFKIGDRALIETDETKLQIIPYVHLLNEAGEVYVYSRGGAGEEARLHGKLSIGLGGHVDTALPRGVSAFSHFQAEAARELLEEVGVTASQGVTFTHLLLDPTDEVGRVHLGIRAKHVISSDTQLTLEAGVIEKGYFKHPNDFTDDELNRLENWSKLSLNLLREGK